MMLSEPLYAIKTNVFFYTAKILDLNQTYKQSVSLNTIKYLQSSITIITGKARLSVMMNGLNQNPKLLAKSYIKTQQLYISRLDKNVIMKPSGSTMLSVSQVNRNQKIVSTFHMDNMTVIPCTSVFNYSALEEVLNHQNQYKV